MQRLLGSAYPDFIAALAEPSPVSIRCNSSKFPGGCTALFPAAAPVPWHPEACYLPERPVFTLDPLFHAGAYYVQEASSMFLYEALRQLADFSLPLRALDLCAAPGGKSTLLAAMLSPDSLLVANEVIRPRVSVLRENLERWGAPNVAVTSAETEAFGALEGWFDIVVTDAPCSGEGLFRKDPDAIGEWSPAHVDLCAARQKRILAGAVTALAPGGLLAYSTCTYNRQEDEENAAWLLAEFDLEQERLQIPPSWGILETEGGYRFFPHRLQGEGFFIALFRKKGNRQPDRAAPGSFRSLQALPKKQVANLSSWFNAKARVSFFQTPTGEVLALPEQLEQDFRRLDHALKIKWFGVHAGVFKGADFVPSHPLALSTLIAPGLPGVTLAREQALQFLKKDVFDLPAGAPAKGWVLAQYQGLNLGWLKTMPNRWNNYLPNERRIRMDIS